MKSIEKTAHHEAGHAIVCVHFRVPLHSITIAPNDAQGTLGCVHHDTLLRGIEMYGGNLSDEEMVKVQQDFVIALAGVNAERLACGRNNHVGAHGDYSHVLAIAMELYPQKTAAAFIEYLSFRAIDILELPDNMYAREHLVPVLLERKTLDGEDATRLIQQFRQEWFQEATRDRPLPEIKHL